MYRLKIVGLDYKSFEIEALDNELDVILNSLKENSYFMNEDKSRGIYIHHPTIRYIYIEKKVEPCQTNQNLEVESDSLNSKEN